MKREGLRPSLSANKSPRFRSPLLGDDGKAGFSIILLLFLALSGAALYFFYPKGSPLKVEAPPDKEEAVENEIKEPGLTIVDGALPQAPEGVTGGTFSRIDSAMRSGDLDSAIKLLREALNERPDSVDLKEALAASLNRSGVNETDRGNAALAKSFFEEAASLSGRTDYLKNLATVEIRLGELEEAASVLEPLADDPEVKSLLKNLYAELGGRLYKRGDVGGASVYFDKAAALDPSDKGASEAAAKLKKESQLEEGMGRAEASHFLVKFEGGENAEAGHLISLLLEEAYVKVGSDLGFYPEDRIEALLYSKEQFRDVTMSPAWAGALFDGRIKIPAGGVNEKTEALEKVVYHEYTHAVVHRLSKGRSPIWLNEGIAQYEEGKSTGAYSEVLRGLAESGKLSLRSLEGSFMGLNARNAQNAYLLSLSATERIIRDNGFSSVRRILEGVGNGESLDSAISSALYLSYDEMERSWAESLKR